MRRRSQLGCGPLEDRRVLKHLEPLDQSLPRVSLHDREVPILFWWPGATAEARATPIETVDIAPTLAAIAHVKTPEVDGQCLDLGGNRAR